jgi:DNA repair protein RecO (recombination protein O)
VTGATEGLALVSPRSGRAVTRAGAGDWADRLLPLPPVLRGEGSAGDAEIAEALAVTGHFLDSRLAEEIVGRPLPAARAALVERIRARAA